MRGSLSSEIRFAARLRHRQVGIASRNTAELTLHTIARGDVLVASPM